MAEEETPKERGPKQAVVVRLRSGLQKLACGHWVKRRVHRRTERRCRICGRLRRA